MSSGYGTYNIFNFNSSNEDQQHLIDSSSSEANIEEFQYSTGLTSEEAEKRLSIYGKNEFPENEIPRWLTFGTLLIQPMPIMIWVAVIIEIIIESYVDMGILLFIQFANAGIAYYEKTKAEDAVASLKQSLKPKADVCRDEQFIEIDATLLVPGDLIKLSSGSGIAADCRINEGVIDVDESQLNGESIPRTADRNAEPVLMGSMVVRGECEATVEFTGMNTFFGKAAGLLNSHEIERSNLDNVLVDMMIVLVCISITLCSIVYVYLIEITSLTDALSFTVILMVASIPLAIEIVTTTTLALGSRELSDHGAIVKRLSCIEDMAGMNILCCDKTGTLTMNKMVLQEHTPIYKDSETQYTLLRYAAMAAKWKEPPKDALDRLVLGAVDMSSLKNMKQTAFSPFDPVIKRTEGIVMNKETNEIFKTTKGAPNVIGKLIHDVTIRQAMEEEIEKLGKRGIRAIAVAKTTNTIHDPTSTAATSATADTPKVASPTTTTAKVSESVSKVGTAAGGTGTGTVSGQSSEEWELLGLLTFLDPPRLDTKQTIQDARSYGVAVKMITGDQLVTASETARVLELGTTVFPADQLPKLDGNNQKPKNLGRDFGAIFEKTDVFAQVYPEHKYLIVEALREIGYKVGMTGDGVNDAPALKRADVGVAVSGSTDAAKAAADLVLTEEGLSTIIRGIKTSRSIFCRIRNFFLYRIAATFQLIFFFFIAVFAFKPSDYQPDDNPDPYDWPDYFHLPVLMLMLITLLNDGSLITIAYDNVIPSQFPEKWNLGLLFFIGGLVLGGIGCLSSLLFLWILLDSWSDTGVLQTLGCVGLSYGQVTTGVYLNISVTTFLTLFSARAGYTFFWQLTPQPSTILVAAGAIALISSTILALAWPEEYTDDVYILGLARRVPYELPVYIWLYCLTVWVFQDACKVWAYKVVIENNWFGINDSTDKGGLITGECCGIGGDHIDNDSSDNSRNVFDEAYQRQLQAEYESAGGVIQSPLVATSGTSESSD